MGNTPRPGGKFLALETALWYNEYVPYSLYEFNCAAEAWLSAKCAYLLGLLLTNHRLCRRLRLYPTKRALLAFCGSPVAHFVRFMRTTAGGGGIGVLSLIANCYSLISKKGFAYIAAEAWQAELWALGNKFKGKAFLKQLTFIGLWAIFKRQSLFEASDVYRALGNKFKGKAFLKQLTFIRLWAINSKAKPF